VNLPPEITRLDRTAVDEIVKTLGEGRTRVARTREEIEVRVGLARMGRELFPWLIIAVALILAAEQLLANRFYRSAGTESPSAGDNLGSRIAEMRAGSSSSGAEDRPARQTQKARTPVSVP
jgi:hypothetical protein